MHPFSDQAECPIVGRFSRRAIFGALASIPAIGGAVAAPAVSTQHDPLVDAIRAYRAGLAEFNANAPEDDDEADAYAEVSYGPPLNVLKKWERPAQTRTGALEALRLIADENKDFARNPVVGSLLAAALAYLEAQA